MKLSMDCKYRLRADNQLLNLLDKALKLKEFAGIVCNCVTRLNSPMMVAKLAELKQRAEQRGKTCVKDGVILCPETVLVYIQQ